MQSLKLHIHSLHQIYLIRVVHLADDVDQNPSLDKQIPRQTEMQITYTTTHAQLSTLRRTQTTEVVKMMRMYMNSISMVWSKW